MSKKGCNRREFFGLAAGAAAAAAVATSLPQTAEASPQMAPLREIAETRSVLVTTTEAAPWRTGAVYQPTFDWQLLNLNIDETQLATAEHSPHAIKGFGACFNELGWKALEKLSEEDREATLKELFDPAQGARLNYCRMPIGANDFATEAYTHDETDGDFELKDFSLAHDRTTLAPFIHAAMRHQPKLRLWASPWTPPSWMKRNHFYAEAPSYPGMKDNGIKPEQIGREGEDMFILEPKYLEAYARYFGRFIDEYAKLGIRIGMVMPQNEFNSAQNFPSCTWTPEGLAKFVRHLGPEMAKRKVEVFFGTLERGDAQMFEKVYKDAEAGKWLRGVGAQWAGKNALAALRRTHPELTLFQSEQECGDGANTWSYTSYCWRLMKNYLDADAVGYMYWNIAVSDDGKSSWGWRQNALVTVNSATGKAKWNHDYYLLKHLTHFVELGARRVEFSGTHNDAAAYLNPDGTKTLLLRNEQPRPLLLAVKTPTEEMTLKLPPDSISTLKMA